MVYRRDADVWLGLCHRDGHEEHGGNQRTKRLLPDFIFVTLTFSSSPIFVSATLGFISAG